MLTLDVDQLEVTSFPTAPADSGVFRIEAEDASLQRGCDTWNYSCNGTCNYSCAGTCWYPCEPAPDTGSVS
jgi:hypothetical protein